MKKETLYLEADEEITTVIDKVVSSSSKLVAIVLPKRANVFHSSVNVKLLKKAAEEAEKHIVIITSEPVVESIAAVAGVHIAKSLTSKPTIPSKKKKVESETTISSDGEDVSVSEVEEHAAKDNEQKPNDIPSKSDDEPIELDNTGEIENDQPEDVKPKKTTKNKFKIPDFNRFRLKVALIFVVLVGLVAGWVYGFVIMPRATVTVNTITSREAVTFEFTVSTGAETLSEENLLLPAKKAEVTKENKATVPATGEKNIGEKATGIVTLTNCSKSGDGITIPAGTGFSSGGFTFLTATSVELGPAVYIGSTCRSADFPGLTSPGASEDVAVVASESGESYNISARSYTTSISGITAFGSDMKGGTTEIVKVISAEDVKKATEQLAGTATAEAVTELSATLEQQQLFALTETLEESKPVLKNSASADDQAEELTVTQTTTYTMLGIQSSDMGRLLDQKIAEALKDKEDKNVRSNGLDKAVLRVTNKKSADEQVLSLQTIAILGPTFDEQSIKEQVAGKKRGDIEKMLENRDGVRSVNVEYSPVWITTTPKSAEKIILVINEVEN